MKENDVFLVVYIKIVPKNLQSVEVWCEKEAMMIQLLLVETNQISKSSLVSPEEGEELASKFGAKFFEASDKNNINISEAFTALVSLMQKSIRSDVKIKTKDKINQKKHKKVKKKNTHFYLLFVQTIGFESNIVCYYL